MDPGMAMGDYKEVLEKLRNIKGVIGASPYCLFQSAAHGGNRRNTSGIIVRGIDSETIDSVSEISSYIRTGGSLDLSKDEYGVSGIVLGSYLALTLGYTDVGDSIYIYGPADINEMFEAGILPPIYKFRITGIFESGYFDYDNAVGLIDIAEA